MARISGVSVGNGGNINALRGRVAASFRRLIPETNLLPGAKRIFSLVAITVAPDIQLKNLDLFFGRLEALGVRSPEDFRRTTIIALSSKPKDRDQNQYADKARYLLNLLGCKFAYRDNELIIGTAQEVNRATRVPGGNIRYKKSESAAVVSSDPAIITPPTATVVKLATTALTVTNEAPISKREFKLKAELKTTVVNLLRSGQAEMAAVMLFSSSERSAYESLFIVREIIRENPEGLFDGHEKLIEILQLQSDVAAAGIAGSRVDTEALFLGYLLGRYAAVAPILAAKVIVAVSSSRLLGLFNIPKAIDILSYMEQDSFRANALVGLAAIGETRFMDKVFKLAIASGGYELVRDHFTAVLDIVHEGHRECFFSAEEYRGETIFRDKKGAVRIYEAENVPLSDRTDLMRPERGIRKVADFTPDYHLILSIRKLLSGNQLQLATKLAFNGYQNAVLRFKTLIRLESGELGALLGAVPQEKRFSLLNDLADGLGENNQEVGEKVALALLKVPKPAEYFHELVLGGARFAARKLMLYGFCTIESDGEYGPLYDELQEKYPEIYRYDYHRFTGFTGPNRAGCFSSVDAPFDLLRKKQLKHYWSILKDDDQPDEARAQAAEMLGKLGAVEYFRGLVKMAHRRREMEDGLTMAIFATIAYAYQLNVEDKKQKRIQTWFSENYLQSSWTTKKSWKTLEKNNWFVESFAHFTFRFSPEAVVQLSKILEDESMPFKIRSAVAKGLGEFKSPSAIPALQVALNNCNVFRSAAEALGKIGKPAIPALTTFFTLKTGWRWDLMGAVAKALGEIGDPSVVPVLVKGLGDFDRDCRSGRYYRYSSRSEDSIAFSFRSGVTDALVKLGIAGISSLVQIIETEPHDIMLRHAERSLKEAEILPSEVTPVLLRAIEDKKNRAMLFAVKALGATRDPRAVSALVRVLGDDKNEMSTRQQAAMELFRINALDSLAQIGKAAIPIIMTFFEWYYNDKIKLAAVVSLFKIKASTSSLLAKGLSMVINKSKLIIDGPETTGFNSVDYVDGNGWPSSRLEEYTIPGPSHFEYGDQYISQALSLLNMRPKTEIPLILSELRKINPELAGLIEEKMGE